MIFDKLVSFVNRLATGSGSGQLRDLVTRARLFALDADAHDVTPALYSKEDADFLFNEFRLPFPVTAVEDTGSCMLVFDPSDQMGLSVDRGFIEVLNPMAPKGAFREDRIPGEMEKRREALQSFPVGSYLLTAGHFSFHDFMEKGFHIRGRVDQIVMFDHDHVKNLAKHTTQEASQGTLRNAATAIQELIYINSGEHFILEERPAEPPKQIKGKNRDRVRQSHERPIYTILRPHQIRTRMGLPVVPANERNSPVPHERRAHVRTLRSERYKTPGKKISVKATWIGPSESVYKGKRYKVLLDM